jgi:hypothetical protein
MASNGEEYRIRAEECEERAKRRLQTFVLSF